MQLDCTTYADLSTWINAWATERKMPLVVVTSRGGLGKTQHARHALAGEPHLWIHGHVTPMQLYLSLYDHCHQPIVIDDVDQLLHNTNNVATLKALCDSVEIRRVAWSSTSKLLEERSQWFDTTSPVLILANDLKQMDANVTALSTRAIHLQFNPTVDAVLAYCEQWAPEKQILAWFRRHRHLFPTFTARDYALAVQMRDSKLDWRTAFLKQVDPQIAELTTLMTAYPTDATRIKHFCGSPATYYRVKKRLKAAGTLDDKYQHDQTTAED